MKAIHCWNDLSSHGIVPLTGEACGLAYRMLCDVTAKGKRILEKAMGVAEIRLQESWNRGSDNDPHVGSVMLAFDVLPFFAVFALLESGCSEVWLTKGNGVVGMERSDTPEQVASFKRYHEKDLVRRFAYGGTAGDRNVHVMSGRIE
jgi:hypothetical protein